MVQIYSDLRYADQMGWNVEDVNTYTGIDRIGLLVPERDMFVDRGTNCLRVSRQRNGRSFENGYVGGIYVKRMPRNFASLNYTLSFSLSRILNGINLSSNTPIDYEFLTNEINSRIAPGGLCIKDWNFVQVCMMEVNRNLILNDDYSTYRRLLSICTYPRSNKKSYKDSVYFQTKAKTVKTIIYDKGKEMQRKMRQLPQKTILRFEIRYAKTKLLTDQFAKYVPGFRNFSIKDQKPYFKYLSSFDFDRYYTDKTSKFMEPFLEFSNLVRPLDLRSGLIAHYSNNRYPDKDADIAIDLLGAWNAGYISRFIERQQDRIIKPSSRSASSPTREKEIYKKAYQLLRDAVIMDEIVNHGFKRIDELKNGLLEPRPNLGSIINPNQAA
ncbi:phage/plasmid replication domain-containing protein [Leptospira santarosai]|uniref:phage/plasmid replication domain-containing protein n=1 Tax=Leptospira santarosai TaxID=28183 RepID=UPI0007742C7D|nr:phage/plasmid replication protein [Leptospira santarosai]